MILLHPFWQILNEPYLLHFFTDLLVVLVVELCICSLDSCQLLEPKTPLLIFPFLTRPYELLDEPAEYSDGGSMGSRTPRPHLSVRTDDSVAECAMRSRHCCRTYLHLPYRHTHESRAAVAHGRAGEGVGGGLAGRDARVAMQVHEEGRGAC